MEGIAGGWAPKECDSMSVREREFSSLDRREGDDIEFGLLIERDKYAGKSVYPCRSTNVTGVLWKSVDVALPGVQAFRLLERLKGNWSWVS